MEHQLEVFTSVINKWMEPMSPGRTQGRAWVKEAGMETCWTSAVLRKRKSGGLGQQGLAASGVVASGGGVRQHRLGPGGQRIPVREQWPSCSGQGFQVGLYSETLSQHLNQNKETK